MKTAGARDRKKAKKTGVKTAITAREIAQPRAHGRTYLRTQVSLHPVPQGEKVGGVPQKTAAAQPREKISSRRKFQKKPPKGRKISSYFFPYGGKTQTIAGVVKWHEKPVKQQKNAGLCTRKKQNLQFKSGCHLQNSEAKASEFFAFPENAILLPWQQDRIFAW